MSLQKQFQASIHALPKEVLINRQRKYGIQLEYLGSPDVLDPKIAIALMPTVVHRDTGWIPHMVIHGHSSILFSKYSAPMLALNEIVPQNIIAHALIQADLILIYDKIPSYYNKDSDWQAFIITFCRWLLSIGT
jgi:hypothetical protein